ncbi:MAG TPA: putative metal-binding motif-containing protein, partial [Sandaracinaceae bacterium LLY-WYZ-13_1]|nr:putative metal-binding motif-containing protein [Sandaracinaceae bacterium LLY-WYZ-13_1]
FDPFEGSCSPTSPTRWTRQGPYRGLPGAACDGTPTCPAGTYEIWTCDDARTSRRRCIDGVDTVEECPYGCVSMPVGTDDVCADPPDADGDGAPADEDCDDADPARHPGATETCGDGVDQDCDGSDSLCPGQDGGPPRDASVTPTDAAAPRPDGAVGGPDAASPSSDGGPEDASLRGSCGCRVPGGRGGPGSLAWLALGLAALVFRRRARRAGPAGAPVEAAGRARPPTAGVRERD